MLFSPDFLSLVKSQLDCLARIVRKAPLLDHKAVQVVSEEVSALTATMTIVDAEERADGPWRILSLRRVRILS